MNVEDIKKLIRALNWSKLEVHLQKAPLTDEDVNNLLEAVYHSDAIVRRRPNDNGVRRNEFLNALVKHLSSAGFSYAVEIISIMRTEFEAIDAGYVAIFESESQLPSNKLTGLQRIAATLTKLQSTAKQIQADVLHSITGLPALMPEPEIRDSEGNRYNPDGVIHNLAAAAFNIIMMEAYREDYFNVEDEIVLPELPEMNEKESEPIFGNFVAAHLWKQWKTVDEKTRFLEGRVKVVHGRPTWVDSSNEYYETVETSLEFEANIDVEKFALIARERFNERQRQTYLRLSTETNLRNHVAPNSAATLVLPPATFLSFEEGHAAMSLHHALSVDIQSALVPGVKLTVSELLRGFASLQLISTNHIEKAGDRFPRFTRAELNSELRRLGLSAIAVDSFLNIATCKRSSRDFFDCPLIRCADGKFLLFGWTIASADLAKLVLSSISSQEGDIEDKGALFEGRMLKMFRELKFEAQNILISRGPEKDVYDYDVVFSWGDYAFFFECKNRNLPGDSPIAVHYFNHTIQSHLKQVRRLRKGLDDHPDILSERFPDAVGKNRVFCVLSALPYASPPVDGICFSDEGLIRRFFESASIGLNTVALNKNSAAPRARQELARLWKGEVPTAEDFVQYLCHPPQLNIAEAHYRLVVRTEMLSEKVVMKIVDLEREVVEVKRIAAMLAERAALLVTGPQAGLGTQSNP